MHVLQAEPFDKKLARKLIESYGADVNHVDCNGQSILVKLVIEKKRNLVEFLLLRGALMHIVDQDQKDACDYAKDNGLALELRQFLNCSIQKKRDDTENLTKGEVNIEVPSRKIEIEEPTIIVDPAVPKRLISMQTVSKSRSKKYSKLIKQKVDKNLQEEIKEQIKEI